MKYLLKRIFFQLFSSLHTVKQRYRFATEPCGNIGKGEQRVLSRAVGEKPRSCPKARSGIAGTTPSSPTPVRSTISSSPARNRRFIRSVASGSNRLTMSIGVTLRRTAPEAVFSAPRIAADGGSRSPPPFRRPTPQAERNVRGRPWYPEE